MISSNIYLASVSLWLVECADILFRPKLHSHSNPTVAQLDWKLTSSQVINLCFITSVALVCRVFPLRSRTDEVNKLCLQSILSRTVFNCTATSCYLPTPVLISTLSQLHLTVLTNLYPPACFLTDDHFDEN